MANIFNSTRCHKTLKNITKILNYIISERFYFYVTRDNSEKPCLKIEVLCRTWQI